MAPASSSRPQTGGFGTSSLAEPSVPCFVSFRLAGLRRTSRPFPPVPQVPQFYPSSRARRREAAELIPSRWRIPAAQDQSGALAISLKTRTTSWRASSGGERLIMRISVKTKQIWRNDISLLAWR